MSLHHPKVKNIKYELRKRKQLFLVVETRMCFCIAVRNNMKQERLQDRFSKIFSLKLCIKYAFRF